MILERLKSIAPGRLTLLAGTLTGIAAFGVITIALSHAATPFIATEPERGTLANGASLVADSTASSSSAVRFNASVSTSAGYHVTGRKLYDPCGQEVIVRGVENAFWNPWLSPDGSYIVQAGRTGANTFRLLPYFPPEEPPTSGVTPLTVAQIENLIQVALANKMIPDVGIAGGRVDVLLQPDVKAMLMKYQNKILIHAMGEGTQSTEATWASESKAGIAQLRAAGYTAPLYVLANTYGRNLPTILHRGQEVLDSDPLHNIVFGWQAYWGEPDNYYQDLYGMTMHQAMQAIRDAPFMIQVGLTYETDPWIHHDKMDYATAMADAQAYGISWLWWDWQLSGNTASLTTDGVYGHWTSPYGQQIALNSANSISNTSIRTQYISTGSCQ